MKIDARMWRCGRFAIRKHDRDSKTSQRMFLEQEKKLGYSCCKVSSKKSVSIISSATFLTCNWKNKRSLVYTACNNGSVPLNDEFILT